MHFLEKTIISNHNINEIYNLVSDVSNYSEFIPWCHDLNISSSNNNHLVAEVTIKALGFFERYTSNVELTPPKDGIARIIALSDSGPFKTMKTQWILKEIDESHTEVYFSIEFQVKSKILSSIVGAILPQACDKIFKSFEERARHIY